MSANLDLVRSIYADWERGDFSRADWADPDIEFGYGDGLESSSRWKGLGGMAEGYANFLRQWEDFRTTPVEYRECGDDCILVFVLTSGRGRHSGVILAGHAAESATTFHLRDGKVVRVTIYAERANALADCGQTE